MVEPTDLSLLVFCFFFNDTATTGIYTTEDTLSLHDALPISSLRISDREQDSLAEKVVRPALIVGNRSEEHTSELHSPSVDSYAVFCLKKKTVVPFDVSTEPVVRALGNGIRI